MTEQTAAKFNHPYKVDDYVVYRRSGVCRIVDIRRENFSSLGEKEYYVMKALCDERSKFYVPADLDVVEHCIRRVLSPDEVKTAIARAESLDDRWDDDSDTRTANFGRILAGGSSAEALWVLKALSLYKKKLKGENKKFYDSDSKLLNEAERIVTEEFSFVLGIKREDVIPYILSCIDGNNAAGNMIF
ncbi:MAG: CarD family transcriptional regulator [Synergistaceae bacterium]|nr:CarD family transcriptional regulator [Synergistaceae bacterium]